MKLSGGKVKHESKHGNAFLLFVKGKQNKHVHSFGDNNLQHLIQNFGQYFDMTHPQHLMTLTDNDNSNLTPFRHFCLDENISMCFFKKKVVQEQHHSIYKI
jgi:hypothetical protein